MPSGILNSENHNEKPNHFWGLRADLWKEGCCTPPHLKQDLSIGGKPGGCPQDKTCLLGLRIDVEAEIFKISTHP